jgi:hypothetical protein
VKNCSGLYCDHAGGRCACFSAKVGNEPLSARLGYAPATRRYPEGTPKVTLAADHVQEIAGCPICFAHVRPSGLSSNIACHCLSSPVKQQAAWLAIAYPVGSAASQHQRGPAGTRVGSTKEGVVTLTRYHSRHIIRLCHLQRYMAIPRQAHGHRIAVPSLVCRLFSS